MQYLHWLVAVSLLFALLERVRPARRAQPVLRKQLANDLAYLLFNGHVYALLAGGVVGWVALQARAGLDGLGLLPQQGLLSGRPIWLQAVVFLVVSDFLQWCVHNLLHRVPLLWQFHKVHHSVRVMDWLANFRFHWMELVVYRSLLYVPLLGLGGDPGPLLFVAVFATAWGHFNHANLAVSLGPLGYVFNSPSMHLWHHDSSSEGGLAKNFGIVLSLWDFLFGCAYWPRERPPAELGYPGIEEMPAGWPGQLAFPLTRGASSRSPA